MELEEWIEEREELEDHLATLDDHVQRAIQARQVQQHTPAVDYGTLMEEEKASAELRQNGDAHRPEWEAPENALDYNPALSPESQISRYFDYFSQLSSPFMFTRVRIGRSPIPTVRRHRTRLDDSYGITVALAFVAYAACLVKPDAQVVFGAMFVICPFAAAYYRPFKLRWSFTSGLLLPLRWPQLVWRDFLHAFRRRFVVDIAASFILTLLLHQQLWLISIWWVYWRLVALGAYTVTITESIRRAGQPWPSRLMTVLMLLVRLVQFFCVFAMAIKIDPTAQFTPAIDLGCLLGIVAAEVLLIAVGWIAIGLFMRRHGTAIPGYTYWPVPFLTNVPHRGVATKL